MLRRLSKFIRRIGYKIAKFILRTDSKPRSKGEAEVIKYLKKRNIKFKKEYKIRCNTEFQKNVYIDFYIPSMNTFIEYNGAQHYKPVELFGGEAQFKRQVLRDNWVREYCKKKNIKLIEIPYYQDVKTFLNFYL